MVNKQSFDEFMSNLIITNATLDYFVDFDKCAKNLDKISIHLHTLDYLLGKSDLKSAVDKACDMGLQLGCDYYKYMNTKGYIK